MKVTIYTDGACSGNPGIGGWGAVMITSNNETILLHGGLSDTTNNQMELIAVIKALEYLKESTEILILTDSKYVMNGMESWIKNWKQNGWKNASKKPVKNRDLWEKLDAETAKHQIEWKWVKGHSGDKNNEKADFLARRFIEKN